jgi:hypothetical protein
LQLGGKATIHRIAERRRELRIGDDSIGGDGQFNVLLDDGRIEEICTHQSG